MVLVSMVFPRNSVFCAATLLDDEPQIWGKMRHTAEGAFNFSIGKLENVPPKDMLCDSDSNDVVGDIAKLHFLLQLVKKVQCVPLRHSLSP